MNLFHFKCIDVFLKPGGNYTSQHLDHLALGEARCVSACRSRRNDYSGWGTSQTGSNLCFHERRATLTRAPTHAVCSNNYTTAAQHYVLKEAQN